MTPRLRALLTGCMQWRNRRGAGGQSAPRDFWPGNREISADLYGKKRQGKYGKGGKMEKKKRKIVKGKVENWKWKEEKRPNWGEDLFFFKMTNKNLFWAYQNINFPPGKRNTRWGKIRKKWFCPLRKKFCYAAGCMGTSAIFTNGKWDGFLKWEVT